MRDTILAQTEIKKETFLWQTKIKDFFKIVSKQILLKHLRAKNLFYFDKYFEKY